MQGKILSKTLWAGNLHERRAADTFAAVTVPSHTVRVRGKQRGKGYRR